MNAVRLYSIVYLAAIACGSMTPSPGPDNWDQLPEAEYKVGHL